MKKQLVNPLALYYDGEIYTFDELSEAQNTQTAADISADVMSEYLGYIEMVCDESGILKYMQEDIDSVRKKYQLDSEQAGLNSDEEETGKNTTDSSGLLDDIDILNETCYGMSNDEIHTMFGEPDGYLSGFWGDIYVNSDNRRVIIYYDEKGKVDFAKLGDETKQTEVIPNLEGVKLPDDDPPIEDEPPD